MDRLELANPSLLHALQGKRIVAVREVVPEKSGYRSVRLFLDDGTAVDIKITGGQGADGGWYDWLTVTVLGTKPEERDEEVFRG